MALADRPVLTVLKAGEFPGYMPGVSQPCVVLDLIVSQGLTQESLQRIERAFQRATPSTADEHDLPARLAVQIASTAVATLRSLGLTAFTPATVNRLGTRPEGEIFRLQVPGHPGCLAQTRQLLIEIVGTGNAAASTEESQNAGSRIKALLRSLKALAPSGRNTLPMLETAHRLGIPWARVHGNIYCLGQGSRARWFDSSITDRTPSVAVSLAKDKSAAAAVLRSRGIPVPDHELVTTEEEALVAAKRLGFPLVVKPAALDRGIGVVSGLKTLDGMLAAFRAAKQHSKRILVESHFEGKDHRIHVFEGEVHRVRYRIPGGVTGDGVSSVRDLLLKLNADPRRGPAGSHAELIRIELDDEAVDLLTEQGLTPDAVPGLNQFVQLRRIANVSVGGISMPVDLKSVHPDNIALAVRAVGALKLDLAAVDFLIPDITKSWTEVGATICEVNAQPQFGADAPELLFSRMLVGQGRIPTVAALFAGPQDRGWMDALREAVARTGTRLGFCDEAECWIGHQRIAMVQPTTAFAGARMLIAHDAVDALLLCADASFLRLGVPVDRFDALVLLGGTGTTVLDAELAHLIALRSGQVLTDAPAQQAFSGKDMPGMRLIRTDRTALAGAVLKLLAPARAEPSNGK